MRNFWPIMYSFPKQTSEDMIWRVKKADSIDLKLEEDFLKKESAIYPAALYERDYDIIKTYFVQGIK